MINELRTYAEFENNDNSEYSPDGILTHITEGFFEENEDGDKGKSQSHFNSKDELSRIRPTHLIQFDNNFLNIHP